MLNQRKKTCLIIAITDESILQLLEDKEVIIEDAFKTIILKHIGSIE